MTYEEYCEMRDKYGFSDYLVSKNTGISRAALSQWKNGNTKLSTANTERLERFFLNVQEYNPDKNVKPDRTFKRPSISNDLVDLRPKSYTITIADGVEVELTIDEYKDLKNGIDAYIQAWAKINKKL